MSRGRNLALTQTSKDMLRFKLPSSNGTPDDQIGLLIHRARLILLYVHQGQKDAEGNLTQSTLRKTK
jgi:hypothetical protein